jgi:pimeloyl-ACP methyl ester carboxylesterase
MSRVTFRNARGLRLVGDLTAVDDRGSSGDLAPVDDPAIVVMAHGFASDRRSRGRFPRIAAALAEAGYASLAFDFTGCGESDDDVLTLEHQIDDLHAAIAYTRALGYGRLALHGHSLGGRVCLAAAPSQAAAIATTGAPTGPMRYEWHDFFSAEQRDELQRSGRVTMPQDEDRARSTVVAGAALLQALVDGDYPALLRGLRCPVLLIDGDGDDEERQAGSRVALLPGSPHNLAGHLDEVIELLLGWFAEHLAPARRKPPSERRP